MEIDGLIILVQLDHLSGEDVGWALKALDYPGIRNRNLIPTLTKKGRMGYLLLLDIDPEIEPAIKQLLFKSFTTHGYHRIETRHVHRQTVQRSMKVVVIKNDREITGQVRFKRDKCDLKGPYFAESDDLFALHQRIIDELDVAFFPWEMRRRLEAMAAEANEDTMILHL